MTEKLNKVMHDTLDFRLKSLDELKSKTVIFFANAIREEFGEIPLVEMIKENGFPDWIFVNDTSLLPFFKNNSLGYCMLVVHKSVPKETVIFEWRKDRKFILNTTDPENPLFYKAENGKIFDLDPSEVIPTDPNKMIVLTNK